MPQAQQGKQRQHYDVLKHCTDVLKHHPLCRSLLSIVSTQWVKRHINGFVTKCSLYNMVTTSKGHQKLKQWSCVFFPFVPLQNLDLWVETFPFVISCLWWWDLQNRAYKLGQVHRTRPPLISLVSPFKIKSSPVSLTLNYLVQLTTLLILFSHFV